MLATLALLLTAISGQPVLIYAPPGKTGAVALPEPKERATLYVEFTVESNQSPVRLLLLNEQQIKGWERGQAVGALASPWTRAGRLRTVVLPGIKLYLGLDNQMEGRSTAEVRVSWRFEPVPTLRMMGGPDPARAQMLLWATGLLSLGITLWTAWKLLKAFQNRV